MTRNEVVSDIQYIIKEYSDHFSFEELQTICNICYNVMEFQMELNKKYIGNKK